MADEDLSQPAGEGASQATEVADTSVSAAAAMIERLEDPTPNEKAPAPASADDDDDDFTKVDEPKDQGEPKQEASESDDDEDEDWTKPPGSEGDEQSSDEIIAPNNSLVRLRDGRKVPLTELKKLADLAPEFQRQQSVMEERVNAIRQEALNVIANERARMAEEAKVVNQIVPFAIAKLRAEIPDPVPNEVWDRDELQAIRMERHRNQKIAELEQLEQAYTGQLQKEQDERQAQEQQRSKQALAQRNERTKTEFNALVEALPALANPEKAKKFAARVVEGGKAYGYTEEQIRGVTDHKMLVALADLARFKSMLAQGQKAPVRTSAPQAASAQPPVRTPGRRTTEAESRGVADRALVDRAKKSRSLADVARAIQAMDR